MWAVIIIVVVIVLLILFLIGIYNGMVRARNRVDESWSGIDVQLKRRHDLIPNLVETVKGYAAHEKEVFENVTQARAAAMGAQGPAQSAQAEGVLTSALGRLFAVAEAYPVLRATENFQQLQAELTNTEDQIAGARRIYNGNVQEYNTKIQTFPAAVFAGMFGFSKREFFELESPADRDVPNVSFASRDEHAGRGEHDAGAPGDAARDVALRQAVLGRHRERVEPGRHAGLDEERLRHVDHERGAQQQRGGEHEAQRERRADVAIGSQVEVAEREAERQEGRERADQGDRARGPAPERADTRGGPDEPDDHRRDEAVAQQRRAHGRHAAVRVSRRQRAADEHVVRRRGRRG